MWFYICSHAYCNIKQISKQAAVTDHGYPAPHRAPFQIDILVRVYIRAIHSNDCGYTSGDDEFSLFLRKAFIKGAGYSDDALDRPIVGIIDTSSSFNPCHGNVGQLMIAVERGVQLAGALPMRFPTISLHESFTHPTSMYLRNLMSIDTEEMIQAQPIDAVVLVSQMLQLTSKSTPDRLEMTKIGGCDKVRANDKCARCTIEV